MSGMRSRVILRVAVGLAALALAAGPAVAAGAVERGVARDGGAAVVSTGPAIAGLQDFAFASMDVEYTIDRAGDGTSTARVVETFVAEFPSFDQNRGMQRRIPDSWQGAPLNPTLVSVTDGAGNPRPVETETDDGHLIVTSRSDDYVHGEQTYVFTYTMVNVVRFFADTGVQEFYWDVNGVDWAQPFGRVAATVRMSDNFADALTGGMDCYRGYQGSTQTCAIARDDGADGGAAIEASADGLAAYETVTVAIGFEPDTFVPFDPSYLASPWGWAQGAAGALGIGAVAFAGVTRSRRLRDEPGRPTIIAEYTPPPGIDALESAVLLGHTTKAIPAEVLEQAVVGSIRIVEGPKRFWGGSRLEAHLVDPSLADGDGRMLLEGLYGLGAPAGSVYEFGRTDTRFSSAAQRILKAASTELDARGMRRPVPGKTRARPVLLAIGAAILMFVFGFVALDAGVNPVVPILMLIAAVLLVLFVAGMMSRRPLTAKGAEVRDHLAGLKVFIEWAEADRIRMLQSPAGAERVPLDVGRGQVVDPADPVQMLRLYEVLLPYAVVFGQEKEWAAQLAVLYGDGGSPTWYSGSSGFNAAVFSAGISSLSSSASASSSTSGGSGGGGSAGGGGGGGGGGGV